MNTWRCWPLEEVMAVHVTAQVVTYAVRAPYQRGPPAADRGETQGGVETTASRHG